MNSKTMKCRICGNIDGNKKYISKEMMFGTREEFEYFECAKCKCVQIKEIPDNLGKYYPKDYNSFDEVIKTKDSFYKKYFKVYTAKNYLNNSKNPFGKYLANKFGVSFLEKIKPTNISLYSSILDIGTGVGMRIVGLARYGFNNLTGIDPFIKKDIIYNNGVKIFKSDIYSFEGEYDLVMLNHSFEHMPHPEKVMDEIYRLLKPNGKVLIRIPVADSYAWKKYNTNWVALDPPRHLHLHTQKSMEILANKSRFNLYLTTYDSSEYQFWASEQFKKNIPIRSETSFYENRKNSIFSDDDIKEYKQLAAELNAKGEGDAACFYLKKKND